VAAARVRWQHEQPRWDPRRLVFIDETALNTKLARLYGRSPIGHRCLGRVPHGHWQTTTFIAALRWDRIDAPFLIEGSANGEVFAAYVAQVLAPELRAGDLVILDNLCIHKTPTIAKLIAAQGASVRYLPPYSPDLNPIEQAFAKLKSHLRSAAARSLDELHSATAFALQAFLPDHCQGFFRHAHYGTN
jgi:transposase